MARRYSYGTTALAVGTCCTGLKILYDVDQLGASARARRECVCMYSVRMNVCVCAGGRGLLSGVRVQTLRCPCSSV